jgi:hypothetical protein
LKIKLKAFLIKEKKESFSLKNKFEKLFFNLLSFNLTKKKNGTSMEKLENLWHNI